MLVLRQSMAIALTGIAAGLLASLWVTGAEVVGDAVLGLAVIADVNLIAGPYYHAVGYPWGPSLSTSQVLGGGTLWILGDIVGVPFFAAQLIQMIREDEAEAKVIDAELDARDAERARARADSVTAGPVTAGSVAGGAPGGPDQAAAVPADDEDRPWWESDPRFAGRFQAIDDGGD